MSSAELENFVFKNQLRRAGMTAHLDMDTHAGQAWLGLRVMLGSVPVTYESILSQKTSKTKEAREGNDAELNAEEAKTEAYII